jgi:maltose alpha-D-glucosyltransferase/alpha-amylase
MAMCDLAGSISALFRSAGPAFLPRQRWFGGKAHRITDVEVADLMPLPGAPTGEYLLAQVAIRYEDKPADRYFAPIAVRPETDLGTLIDPGAPDVLGRVDTPEGPWTAFDATADSDFCRLLVRRIQRREPVEGARGRYTFQRVESATPGGPDGHEELPLARVERIAAEQSNTSVIYDRRLILKAFRRLAAGLNPDVEIGHFLTTQTDFRNVPRVYGYFEYAGENFSGSLGVVQDFVASRGDGWRYTLDALADLRRRAAGHGGPADPTLIDAWLGDYFRAARRLGAVTGRLHAALATGTDPAFAPEPIGPADLTGWTAAIEASLDEGLAQLRRSAGGLAPAARDLADRVLAREADLRRRIGGLRDLGESGLVKTRYHGDYHLGQVLWTGDDFVILDFEGEPARPLEQRRAKQPPLKDVAGMLRSFDYAAATAAQGAADGDPIPPDWPAWLAAWQNRTVAEYLDGYLAEADRSPAPIVPRDPDRRRAWIDVFALEKAIYELGYELNNRPDWVAIPLRALAGPKSEG